MPPEQFFRGATQAGRELALFYEHTAYETFTDERGPAFDNPSETRITGTLDGAPIEVEAVNWSGGTATVRSGDRGTFTATNTDYADDHSRPCGATWSTGPPRATTSSWTRVRWARRRPTRRRSRTGA